MSVYVYDGFDHYLSQDDMGARIGRLQWNSIKTPGSFPINFVTGPFGTGLAIQMAPTNTYDSHLLGVLTDQKQTYRYNFRLLFLAGTATTLDHFEISIIDPTVGSQGTAQVTFYLYHTTGVIEARKSSGNVHIASSPPNSFSPYTMSMYEFEVKVDGSLGSIAVRVNGNDVLSASNVNTQSTANATSGGIFFYLATSSGSVNYMVELDDFAVGDNDVSPGSYPSNSWLGDLQSIPLFAIGNDSVQWTPLANTNWQEISEVRMDGDTSYNYSANVGDQDTFNMGSLPAFVANVIALQLTGAYRKTDATSRVINQLVASSGSSQYGANWSIPGTYAYVTDIFPVDPHTGSSWTLSAVNAMKVGYKLEA